MELRLKELAKFYGVSEKTASKRKREIVEYFSLNSSHLEIWHLAKYEKIPVNEVKKILEGQLLINFE